MEYIHNKDKYSINLLLVFSFSSTQRSTQLDKLKQNFQWKYKNGLNWSRKPVFTWQ